MDYFDLDGWPTFLTEDTKNSNIELSINEIKKTLICIQVPFNMDNRTVKEASVEGIQRRRTPKKHFVSFAF